MVIVMVQVRKNGDQSLVGPELQFYEIKSLEAEGS